MTMEGIRRILEKVKRMIPEESERRVRCLKGWQQEAPWVQR
jgi:hypothetical protein